jgi:membrane associated rhomboid family serine protease
MKAMLTKSMMNIDWRATALERTANVRRRLLRQAILLGVLVALLWVVEIVDAALLRGLLDGYGIQPRSLGSLPAVMVSPLLHAGFGHLLANTIPLIVLGWMVLVRGTREFFIVGIFAAIASGLGIWLFGGANTLHLGISGVIFGFLGYLLARGYYERSPKSIALAVTALLLYGSMLWGVLPLQEGISWQGHLFGFLGGVVAAYWLAGKGRGKRQVTGDG